MRSLKWRWNYESLWSSQSSVQSRYLTSLVVEFRMGRIDTTPFWECRDLSMGRQEVECDSVWKSSLLARWICHFLNICFQELDDHCVKMLSNALFVLALNDWPRLCDFIWRPQQLFLLKTYLLFIYVHTLDVFIYIWDTFSHFTKVCNKGAVCALWQDGILIQNLLALTQHTFSKPQMWFFFTVRGSSLLRTAVNLHHTLFECLICQWTSYSEEANNMKDMIELLREEIICLSWVYLISSNKGAAIPWWSLVLSTFRGGHNVLTCDAFIFLVTSMMCTKGTMTTTTDHNYTKGTRR
jgi:hypothetical protein